MKTIHIKTLFFIMMAAALVLGSCAPAAEPEPTEEIIVEETQPPDTPVTEAPTQPVKSGEALEIKSQLKRVTSFAVSESETAELVSGNSQFALDLYQELRGEEGNLFYSPYSISLALAMTYGGARENTAAEMANTLSYILPDDRLHEAYNALDQTLASRGEGMEEEGGFQLNIANSIWAQEDYPFLDEYLDLLGENYGAGLWLVNFATAAEEARLAINDWVSEKTEEKIKDLIPQGAIDSMTRLVLANAIYFKADWQTPFDADRTKEEPFFLIDGTEIMAPMMSMFTPPILPYYKGEDYEAAEVPYKGEQLSMVLVVPNEGMFQEVEDRFSAELLSEVTGSMEQMGVDLTLPKFEFESTIGLSDTLQSMGMMDAFGANADFSGMDGTLELFIQDVLHKAFVSVDEQGTEAAAATAVIVGLKSIPILDVVLTVDRPFLFFIRDIPTGSILFVGRVMNPLD